MGEGRTSGLAESLATVILWVARIVLSVAAIVCGLAAAYFVLLSLSPGVVVDWPAAAVVMAGMVTAAVLFGLAATRLATDAIEGRLLALAGAGAVSCLAAVWYPWMFAFAALGVFAAGAALLYPPSYLRLIAVSAYLLVPELFQPVMSKLTGPVDDPLTQVGLALLWPLVVLGGLPTVPLGFYAGIAGPAAVSALALVVFARRRMRSPSAPRA
jgi:hypothetical protein